MSIAFPITVNKISFSGSFGFAKKSFLADGDEKCGAWVSIRPIDDKLKGKTFLGIYLGELCTDASIGFIPSTGELKMQASILGNPAIYVPDLKRVVMGYESWWGIISSPEGLREISDADIQNVWYARALKELSDKNGDANSQKQSSQ